MARPAMQRVTAFRAPADRKAGAEVYGRVRPPAPTRSEERAKAVEILLADNRLARQMPQDGLRACLRVGVSDPPAVDRARDEFLERVYLDGLVANAADAALV